MSPKRKYVCDICGHNSYSSVLNQKHKAEKHYCYVCRSLVHNKVQHYCRPVQVGFGGFDPSPFTLTQAGLDTFQVFSVTVSGTFVSVEKLIRKYYDHISRLITHLLSVHKNIKARLIIRTHLIQQKTSEEKVHDLGTTYSTILNTQQIKRFVFDQTSHIIRRLNFYNTGGSSWAVLSLPSINIHVAKYKPLKIGDGIATPACYKKKHGLINISVRENLCFVYCIIARYLNLKTVSEGRKIKQYTDFMSRNYNDKTRKCAIIDFNCLPSDGFVSLEDIKQFEKYNESFSVNVFAHDDESKCIYPLRITEDERSYHADLMLLSDVEKDKNHFVLIVDFDLFMKEENNRRRLYCKRCLQSFGSESLLLTHQEICSLYAPQRIEFPVEESVDYTMGANQIEHIFWVSADFETYMKTFTQIDEDDHKMKILSKHIPLSYAFAYVGAGSVSQWKYYDGPEPDREFIVDMLNLADYHLSNMSMYKQVMKMTASDWMDYVKSKTCVICKQPLEDEDVEGEVVDNQEVDDGYVLPKRMRFKNYYQIRKSKIRVRHHFHGSTDHVKSNNSLIYEPARYRGAAHLSCNLQLKSRTQLTIVMHNFSNFDSKIVLEGCAKANVTDIKILAKSSEKVLSLMINGKLRFIDSNLHLTQSLANLSTTLRKGGLEKFHCTQQILRDRTDEEYDMILSKQAFPYEYAHPNTLDIPSNTLPPKKVFFSSLKNKNITDEEYAHAQLVYKKFGCESLRDYLRLYNLLDVGILADVVEEHRVQCRDMYDVDPLNFLTLPSVSFNVGMSASGQTLDYIRDIDLYLEVKRATRGGVVNFSRRHAKANIPQCEDYDSSKPQTHLIQLDINSLYSLAMTKKLPTRNFIKLSQEEIDNFDISSVDENGSHGFLLNVDVSVPDNPMLHDFLKELPPLPEKIIIDESCASEFQKTSEDDNPSLKSYFGAEQYLCTLFDKKNYSAFVPTLKQALDVGLKIDKINTIWKFEQRAFVKGFVEQNVTARTNAECASRKQTLKLILNAFYGRTTINTGKFRDFSIVTDHIKAQKLVRQPNFKSSTIINEAMAIIEMKRKVNYVNNHMIVGAAILDIAKAYFYKVWYEIKRHFGEKVSLLYTDTDSYLLSLETDNILLSLSTLQLDGETLMDFSYLPETDEYKEYKCDINKGVVGKLKSETDEKPIVEAIVLKKKQYALKLLEQEKKRNRGTPAPFMEQYFFSTYKDSLFNGDVIKTKITMLRSIKLQLYNIQQHRLSFTPICCSRFLLGSRGIDSLPFGHYSIRDGELETVFEDILE